MCREIYVFGSIYFKEMIARADGKIVIDTEVDTSGAKKGTQNLAAEQIKVRNDYKKTQREIERLSKSIADMETPKIDTKELDKVNAKIEETENKIVQLAGQQGAREVQIRATTPAASEEGYKNIFNADKEWQNLDQELLKAQDLSEKYYEEQEKIQSTYTTQIGTDKYKKEVNQLADAKDKLTLHEQKMKEIDKKYDEVAKSAKKVGKASKKSFDNASKSASKASGSCHQFATRLKSIVAGAFVFNIVSAALRNLTQYMGNALKSNKQFSSNLASIKGNLLTAFQPIYDAILPAINAFMSGLSTLTAYIAKFTSMIFGTSVKASSQNAKALYGQAKALDKTAESAKKANKQLSYIDELQVVQKSDDTSETSGTGTSQPNFNTVEVDNEFPAWLDEILKSLEPIKNALSDLWNNGLAKFKDFGIGVLDDFYNSFLKPMSTWTLGTGIPNLIGSLNKLLNMIDWKKLCSSLNGVWKALEPFAEQVGTGLLWFIDNILVPLGVWVMNDVVPAFLNGLSGVIDILSQSLENFKPIFQWLWDYVLAPLAEWTGGVISTVFNDLAEAIDWIAQNEIAVAILDGIVLGILAWKAAQLLLNLANFAFNGILNANPIVWLIGIIALLVVAIVELVKHWDDIKAVVGAVWDKISEVFGNIGEWFKDRVNDIKTAFANIGEWFKNIFSKAWSGIKSVFSGVSSFFLGVIDGIKSVFITIPNWFKSVFTKAWEGVKKVFTTGSKIFTGIVDGIAEVFKSVVNAIIGGINKVIAFPFDKINGLLNGIRDISIMGFEPFSGLWGKNPLPVPQIPYLATGTVVPANYGEFMAVLGDNKREPEVVSPLSTMKQAMKEVIAENGGNGEVKVNVYLEGDAQGVFRVVRVENDKHKKMTGRSAFA